MSLKVPIGFFASSAGYSAETLAYKIRVEADGGLINDIDKVDADIVFLKSLSLFTVFDRIYLPYGGMKLRVAGGNWITKWYDVKGVTGDCVQATEASQPEYGGDQINGIDVVTGVVSKMGLPSISIATSIYVATGLGYIYGNTGSPYFNRLGTTTIRIRDNASNYDNHTVIDKDLSIDSMLLTGGNAYVWRNKTASSSNPLAKSAITLNQLFCRGTSSYFVGTCGLILLSETAISEVNRALIEDYYIALFNIT